jgi:hypothetical protein
MTDILPTSEIQPLTETIRRIDPSDIPTSFAPRPSEQVDTQPYAFAEAKATTQELKSDQGIEVLVKIVAGLDGPVPDYIVEAFRGHDQSVRGQLSETESLNKEVHAQAGNMLTKGSERTSERIKNASSTYLERRVQIEQDADLQIANIATRRDNAIKVEHQRASTVISNSQQLQAATVDVFDTTQTAVSDVQRKINVNKSLLEQNIQRREADFELIKTLDARRNSLPQIISDSQIKLDGIQTLLDKGELVNRKLAARLNALEEAEDVERLTISADEISAITNNYVNNTNLPPAGVELAKANILAEADSPELDQILIDIVECKDQKRENKSGIAINEKLYDAEKLSINEMKQELAEIPILIREACMRLVVELDVPVREVQNSSDYLSVVSGVLYETIQGKLSKFSGIKMPRTAAGVWESMLRLKTIGQSLGTGDVKEWVPPVYDDIELFSQPMEGDDKLLKTFEGKALISNALHEIAGIKKAMSIGKVARGLVRRGIEVNVTQLPPAEIEPTTTEG